MNGKLILLLSLFGLAMAVGTIHAIPPDVEPLFWLGIFLVCAVAIARRAPGRFFLHGFLVSLLNSVWMTGGHILFYRTYLAGHPREAAMMSSMPIPDAPRLMMLLMGPIVAIATGVFLGLLAHVASKIVRPA